MRRGKVFIDTNIIQLAAVYKKSDVIGWINQLYEDVYIHISVLNELLLNRSVAEKQIHEQRWQLFDPDDVQCLSHDEFEIYRYYERYIGESFKRLYEKKRNLGMILKSTSNLGEIHTLAAAMLLQARIICSNDYEIREIIHDEEICTAASEYDTPELIIQDTLEDFCFFCVQNKVATKKEVRQLFKVANAEDNEPKRQRKLNALNARLNELSDS